MEVNKKKIDKIQVFVSGKFATHGIYEDQIVSVGEDRFRSTKFRNTYYTSSDFHLSKEASEEFIMQKYGLS